MLSISSVVSVIIIINIISNVANHECNQPLRKCVCVCECACPYVCAHACVCVGVSVCSRVRARVCTDVNTVLKNAGGRVGVEGLRPMKLSPTARESVPACPARAAGGYLFSRLIWCAVPLSLAPRIVNSWHAYAPEVLRCNVLLFCIFMVGPWSLLHVLRSHPCQAK